MGTRPDRIQTMRDVDAMVALDTIDLLAGRVRNLLAHGRRMALMTRYTHTGGTPSLAAGLTLDGELGRWSRDGNIGMVVRLRPGLQSGFGFSAYAGAHDTEAAVWAMYHGDESKREDLTEVRISGGMDGDGPARSDHLTVRHWNTNGVCKEVVVAFDPGPDPHDDDGLAALDAALDATGREQGDPQPTAEELLAALTRTGYTVVRNVQVRQCSDCGVPIATGSCPHVEVHGDQIVMAHAAWERLAEGSTRRGNGQAEWNL